MKCFYLCLVSCWQGCNEVVGIGRLGCLMYLCLCSSRATLSDILIDGGGKQCGLLANQADLHTRGSWLVQDTEQKSTIIWRVHVGKCWYNVTLHVGRTGCHTI